MDVGPAVRTLIKANRPKAKRYKTMSGAVVEIMSVFDFALRIDSCYRVEAKRRRERVDGKRRRPRSQKRRLPAS
jgi:hypothetical protein